MGQPGSGCNLEVGQVADSQGRVQSRQLELELALVAL
jgi:hypothetical protein